MRLPVGGLDCAFREDSKRKAGGGCNFGAPLYGTCEWCSEDVAGDTSDSYLSGCMFCDGLIGHHKDD
jgi:hypothetical protein